MFLAFHGVALRQTGKRGRGRIQGSRPLGGFYRVKFCDDITQETPASVPNRGSKYSFESQLGHTPYSGSASRSPLTGAIRNALVCCAMRKELCSERSIGQNIFLTSVSASGAMVIKLFLRVKAHSRLC